jgi:acetate kinase
MPGPIAVINAGSSSVKFAIYDTSRERELYRGQVEGIGTAPHLRITDAARQTVTEQTWPAAGFDHDRATREILAAGQKLMQGTVSAIGHRVVHGGRAYASPMRVTPALLDELEKLIPLAPLHQPHNLAPVRTILAAAPHVAQVVCFDTAFHRSQPHLAQAFALPRPITNEGVQRYGFHGLSYDYLVSRLRVLAPALAERRVIIAHLGNGASLCAVKQGRSVASTMGFTALDGLMMGTRSGALDPGVILYLLQQRGMDAKAIEDLLYRRSGLLGVSGISSDMRALRASSDPAARAAIDLFVYRIVREIGSLAAALGGVDGLVFSGGIGEHDAMTRAEVAAGCEWLGVALDPARNARGDGRISRDESRVAVWAIPTDEELLIARQTAAVVAAG